MEIRRLRQLAFLTLVAILVLATVLLSWRESISRPPGHLIAKAYSERRTLELRIANASYSSMRVRRGQDESRMDRPQSLLDAEAAIARGLRSHPADAAFLTARGDANLLEWSYEAAITDMQEALDAEPKSAIILDGLAMAYFERGEAEDRFEDYGTAFELQSRALQQSPDDPVVRFNRAITASRLFLFKQSMEDFTRYLGMDSSGDWADEARQHLSEVKAIVDAHDRRTKARLLTPAEFVSTVTPSRPETWEKVEPRIEEYLSLTITEWLPAAFPVRGKGPASSEARQALETLALILRNSHGDRWLKDLLLTTDTPQFALAVKALGDSFVADRMTEDFERARTESTKAERLFAQGKNLAGSVRAQFEQIYALHFLDAGPECTLQVKTLSPAIKRLEYEWLQLQLRLESFNCAAEAGDFGWANELIEVRKNAHERGYEGTSLRSIGLLAFVDFFNGRTHAGWALSKEGLSSYWTGTFDATLGYNLYAAIDFAAQDVNWHLDRSAADEALTVANPTGKFLTRAVEYTDLARAAVMAREPTAAFQSLQTAQNLLSEATPTRTTQNYRVTVESYTALVDGQLGHLDLAISRLERMRPQLEEIRNIGILGEFYSISGKLQSLANNSAAAERELEKAVALSQSARSSLHSEADRMSWMRQWAGPYLDLIEEKLLQGKDKEALSLWELYRTSEAARQMPLSTSPPMIALDDAGIEAAVQSVNSDLTSVSERIGLAASRCNQQTVLVLALLPHGVGMWTCDDRGVTGQMINDDPETVRLETRRVAELSSQPSSSIEAIRATSHELYRALIGPAADRIPRNRALAFEVDDALSSLPFQVLTNDRGEYLAEEHVITYLPTLDYLADGGREDRIVESAKVLVVASPAGTDSGLRPLGDAITEAKSVANHFSNSQLLIGEDVSPFAILSRLGAIDVFHFAGHTLEIGGQVGLLLRQDQENGQPVLLTVDSLNNAPLAKLRLAVLSACSTGKGSDGALLDFDSLARVFLAKGVPHVVASRWDVDSASSAFLISVFYDKLAAGATVPQALASAEVALRRRSPHPYYWAGFDVFGNN
jgi:CHAT domain-containing protein/tetratricopeptide (TPR) repeat protein